MAFYTKLCKNIKVFLVYMKKPEFHARKSGPTLKGGDECPSGLEGGPTTSVGHTAPKSRWFFL
jgi:hypothetical protein